MTLLKQCEQFERDLIKKELIKHKWNIARVAKILGVARPTVYRKIKKYKISIYNCDLCRDQCWLSSDKLAAPYMCECHPHKQRTLNV